MTKGELHEATQLRAKLAAHLKKDILLISAVTGTGLRDLTERIAAVLLITPL